MANKQFHSERRIAQENPGQQKRKRRVIGGGVLALLVCFAIGNVYGRYVQGANNTGTVSAKAFYFSSNFLDGTTYSVQPGEDVAIDLNNFNIENMGLVSEVEIGYTVTITDVTDGGAPKEVSSGTLSGDAAETDSVTLDAEETVKYQLVHGHLYKITAEGDGGYKQTLTANLQIGELSTNVYKYLKETGDPEHQLLMVWTENWTGDAAMELKTAKRGHGVMFNPNNGNGSTVTVTNVSYPQITDALNFQIPATSHTYDVVNPERVALTADDFTVIIGGKEAISKVPAA